MAAPKGNQYAKNPNGRPLVYDDDYLENLADELLAWLKDFLENPKKIYLIAFCTEKCIPRQRLAEFAEKNKKFCDAYNTAKAMQEHKFAYKALNKEWDVGFVQYLMARVQGDMWKRSYDMPESTTIEHIGTVTIQKVVKEA